MFTLALLAWAVIVEHAVAAVAIWGTTVYFAAGGVSDLVEWFNGAANSEKMLCLFVPKDPEDEKLLRDLFDARGLISPQLGDVAFCLFSSRATIMEARARNPAWADYLFIPGLTATCNMPNDGPIWKPNLNWQAIEPMRAELIPAHVRDEVMLRSEAITDEIIDYFDLDRADVPCMVFLSRNDATPFVIQTRGSANLTAARDLFADLRSVVELLGRSGMLSLPSRVAERQSLLLERSDLETTLQEHHADSARALAAAADASSMYGLSGTIRGIDPKWAHHLFRYLGLPHRDKRPLDVSPETRLAAAEAMMDPAVHMAFRRAVEEGKKRRKIEINLEAVNERVSRLDRQLAPETLSAGFETVEDRINAICEKYEKRFKRASHYMVLRKFVRVITGAAKAAESVTTSIGSTVDNIAKSLPSSSE